MRSTSRAGVLLLIGALLSLLLTNVTTAENVTVTIGVGDNILEVSGKTSPAAFVTILRDGSVIGTTTAGSDGAYSQTFPAQEPGLHQLSVYGHTVGNENTDTINFTLNIAEHATTQAYVFLPSTVILSDTSLTYGQPLEIHGESAPSSTITVYIDNTDYATTTSDTNGNWDIRLDTTALAGGQHEFFVRVTDALGTQSYPSTPRTFSTTTNPAISPIPQPSAQTSQGAPAVPAITFPANGAVWENPTITVQGTAAPEVQIELWDETRNLSSVWSNSRGQWSLLLSLEQKEYGIRARACLHRKCSGFSPTVQFRAGPFSPSQRALRIIVPRSSFTIYQNEELTAKALVVDGKSPYRAQINWGDTPTQQYAYSTPRLLFTHRYAKTGSYTIIADVSDATGRKNRIYFSVDVKPRHTLSWLLLLLGALLLLLILLPAWYRKRQKTKITK